MKPINILNKLNESVQPLDKEKYFNLMDAVDELIISVNGNKAQLQDVLKDVTEMFNKAINKLTESEYRYVTTHGTGPGTLPKDVNLIKSEDINSNGKVAIYVDRPLTKEELEKYDIRPEWIQEGNDKRKNISESSDYGSEDWKCFEHHKNEFKDYYELPHGILFRDKNKPIYGVIMDGKFMLDAEPIPKDGKYRTDNSTLDTIELKDEDFSPVEDFVDYYIPSDYKYDAVAGGRCPYCDKKLGTNDKWFVKKYGMCQGCFEDGVE